MKSHSFSGPLVTIYPVSLKKGFSSGVKWENIWKKGTTAGKTITGFTVKNWAMSSKGEGPSFFWSLRRFWNSFQEIINHVPEKFTKRFMCSFLLR
jgi:hypothetical protein